MLSMAKTMAALKADWSGTLVVYAQPAEEVGNGAQTMVEDKLWERGFPKPDYAFGAHTAPGPVGSIVTGRGNNIIPTDAVLKLNLRWFIPEVSEQMLKRIDEIGKGVAIAAGVSADQMPTRFMKGHSGPLVNDKALVARLNPSLEALMGQGKVVDQFPAVMGSEDFQEAFTTLGKVPYLFILVGVAPPEMFTKPQ